MRAWLHPALDALERGEAAMLVHVVALKGSGPREAGAQMLVMDGGIAGTIGGGELEHTAMLQARTLLNAGQAGLQRFSLGPELNQCCGGAVTLAFEPFAPADLAWLKKLARVAEEPAPLFRTVTIEEGGAIRRDWEAGAEDEAADFVATLTSPLRGGRSRQAQRSRVREGVNENPGRHEDTHPTFPAPDGLETPTSPQGGGGVRADAGTSSPEERGLAVEIRERVNPPAPALWLFGAGHVGQALVPALHPLGFAITWIDGRAGQLPEPPLPGVKQLALAMPELAVDEAPPDTIFLVMTHSHPLDEAVCEAALRRGDFAYLGLIGSDTKRARFVKRLAEAGIPKRELERLTCPIGLPGIDSKEPAAIAASVAADLLRRRQAGFAAMARDGAIHER